MAQCRRAREGSGREGAANITTALLGPVDHSGQAENDIPSHCELPDGSCACTRAQLQGDGLSLQRPSGGVLELATRPTHSYHGDGYRARNRTRLTPTDGPFA